MQFTDHTGQQWSFRLTLADNSRLKESGFDLFDPQTHERIFADTLTIIEVIAELLRPKWEEAGLKYEQFVDLLTWDVDTLPKVINAFTEGLTNFFQRAGKPALAAVIAKAVAVADRQNKIQMQRVNSPKVEKLIEAGLAKDAAAFDEQVDRALQQFTGGTSPSVPASLAATGDRGPIASSPKPHELG
jgi:hypothetical protein